MRRKLPVLLLCAFLLALACGNKLARPERLDASQDQFIGFHLVYEKMPPSMEEAEAHPELYEKDYSNWTEYGSDQLRVEGLGQVSFPRMILIGTQDADGHYVFPGLEGKNCFLAVTTQEDGSHCYGGYVDMADCKLSIGTEHSSLSGAVYFGPPLDDSNWNTENFDYCWTAYRVYQMPDGTVYLDGGGNSYGGVGGFSFSVTSEQTVTEGNQTSTTSLEVSVSIHSVSRLQSVSVRQYSGEDQLLRADTLTAEQASEIGSCSFPLEAETAYVIVVETGVDGAAVRTLYQTAPEGISFTSWFLDNAGMGYPVPVLLEP